MIGKIMDSGWRDWDYVAKSAMDDAEIQIDTYLVELRTRLMLQARNNVDAFLYSAKRNNASVVEWHNHHLEYEADETKERWINTFDIDALIGSYGVTFDNLIQEQGRNNFVPSALIEYKSFDDNSKGNFSWAQNKALYELSKLCGLPGLVVWTINLYDDDDNCYGYCYAYRVVWAKNSKFINQKGFWSEKTYIKNMCNLRGTPDEVKNKILKNKSNKIIDKSMVEKELKALGW